MRSIKKYGKAAVTGVLVIAMTLSTSARTGNAQKYEKKESVYAEADASGKVSELTVSSTLKNIGDMSGKISDRSDLTEIKNIKGDEKFSQNGDAIEWDAQGKDIYYQGKSTEELPVGVNVSYKLDGKDMNPEDMKGKKGSVEIHVKYTNNSKTTETVAGKEYEVYTPFMMMTGMILSSENFSNIEIDNGKVVDDGTNCFVVGMGVPGLAESLDIEDKDEKIPTEFTIKAETDKFSLMGTYTFVTSDLLNDVKLDDIKKMDELEEKLEDLTDATDELIDGAGDLNDGTDEYAEKMGELKSSMKEYSSDGIKKITKGISKLAANGKKLVKGTADYTKGVGDYVKGTTDYVAGAKKIADGNTKLYNSVKDVPSQINEFNKGLKKYTAGVDTIGKKENVKALKEGAAALSGGITTLNNSLSELKESYAYNTQIAEGLKEIETGLEAAGLSEAASNIKLSRESLEGVSAKQKAGIDALCKATSKDGELKKGAETLSGGIATAMDGAAKLSENSKTLTDAADKLKNSMPELVKGAKELKDGSTTLTKNNSKLNNGAKKLKSSGKTFKKSIKKLNKGMQTLDAGGDDLKNATKKLSNGIDKLESASGDIADGADDLYKGTKKYKRKGIDKLNNVYEDDLKGMVNRMKAIKNAGTKYNNFSGKGDSVNGDVRFIIKTAALETDE